MSKESYEEFQYNSCISRGICSISPQNSALQTIIVLYLRLFAKYTEVLKISKKTETIILNTIAITFFNPYFSEKSFDLAIKCFKTELKNFIENCSKIYPNTICDEEKKKTQELFKETENIIDSIKFGEKIALRASENIPTEIRDLYNIMLIITKSISINLLDLKSYEKNCPEGFSTILDLLSHIDVNEKNVETLKLKILEACKINITLMQQTRDEQEKRYGKQIVAEVSYSTTPNKAILVVGANIRELENVLEALKEENIDIYTHDDMMLAHTFPKFSEYKHLKGQFGQGIENCLLDFATFPGPIILTKHSLHNIENFYRGRLFTTDCLTETQGIIKIEKNDFSKVIDSAKKAKGFKQGKICENVTIGFNFDETVAKINKKMESHLYNRIFIINSNNYSLEQKNYFEKLIKHTPENTLIISFSHNIEKNNLVYINTCFDNLSWFRIFEKIKIFNLPTTIFIPHCERDTISQIIYLSEISETKIYLGKCTPILLNPTLMLTLQDMFSIKTITTAKKDLEEILEDK